MTIEVNLGIEKPGSLSSKTDKKQLKMDSSSRLIHPSLENIPKNVRFLAVGVLLNVIFIVGLEIFSHESILGSSFEASTIYAIFYTFYLPISHALQALFVFGWPLVYFTSLASVMPIGISAMFVGTFATDFLDSREAPFSSVIVLVLTSLWSYFLTNLVMSDNKKDKTV